MTTLLRKTGIGPMGGMPWGTHVCLFYEDKEDLIDTLVGYFKAGLEGNEFCVWAPSGPLTEAEAKVRLGEAFPDFVTQVGDESRGLPVSVGNGADKALAEGATAAHSRHVGGCAGLVDEDQPGWIKTGLAFPPGLPGSLHIRSLLFGGVRGFF